jgi:hypothetical protein
LIPQTKSNPVGLFATATIPELQQSKTAALNTLASKHSRRSYEYTIERFIAGSCSEPPLAFNRSVVVRYPSPAGIELVGEGWSFLFAENCERLAKSLDTACLVDVLSPALD